MKQLSLTATALCWFWYTLGRTQTHAKHLDGAEEHPQQQRDSPARSQAFSRLYTQPRCPSSACWSAPGANPDNIHPLVTSKLIKHNSLLFPNTLGYQAPPQR